MIFPLVINIYAQDTSIASGLGLYVFPSNDQNKDTQDADEVACYKWAKEQTGIDPINPPQVEVKQADSGPDGSAVVGGAKGAAAGAAIGAVVGGLGGRRARIAGDQAEQQQNVQAAQAQEKGMMDNFKKAFTACMEGKGYTVK